MYHQISWRSYCKEQPQQQKKVSSTEADPTKVNSSEVAIPQQKKVNPEVGAVKQYVFNKYFAYVQNYATNILEKQFPEAIRIYRVFSVGIKVRFISDLP